ncbi:MAG: penicillin-insensitive murein endopeptidase [Deltaproteobacteria bacterium]|nr:penicillin-insensitive murein endopeptidase [Deltaproteobacteria bacterium]MBN2670520.1 penicillin-insensitive murein endopeptidase [Deltaproteobacteria bacterium]
MTTKTAGPIGGTSDGVVVNACEMPSEGEGYAFYHKRDRRYGSEALTGLVERVSKKVMMQYPDSILKVGDLSGKGGGKITGHSSHRTGLDVDLAFFVRNPARSYTGDFLLALHDPNGVAVVDKEVGLFDMEKNWAVVEALLTDTETQVQWIFVSKGLKARLLAYALHRQKDLSVIEQAAAVLHQPGDSAIHNDHFHIRIYCPDVETSPACAQRKPIWPWVKPSHSNSEKHLPSDDALVHLALEGL